VLVFDFVASFLIKAAKFWKIVEFRVIVPSHFFMNGSKVLGGIKKERKVVQGLNRLLHWFVLK